MDEQRNSNCKCQPLDEKSIREQPLGSIKSSRQPAHADSQENGRRAEEPVQTENGDALREIALAESEYTETNRGA